MGRLFEINKGTLEGIFTNLKVETTTKKILLKSNNTGSDFNLKKYYLSKNTLMNILKNMNPLKIKASNNQYASVKNGRILDII